MEKQTVEGWGESVVERLAADLRFEFPELRGFSPFNVWRMRQLYLEYTSSEFLAQAVPESSKPTSKFPAQPDGGKTSVAAVAAISWTSPRCHS